MLSPCVTFNIRRSPRALRARASETPDRGRIICRSRRSAGSTPGRACPPDADGSNVVLRKLDPAYDDRSHEARYVRSAIRTSTAGPTSGASRRDFHAQHGTARIAERRAYARLCRDRQSQRISQLPLTVSTRSNLSDTVATRDPALRRHFAGSFEPMHCGRRRSRIAAIVVDAASRLKAFFGRK